MVQNSQPQQSLPLQPGETNQKTCLTSLSNRYLIFLTKINLIESQQNQKDKSTFLPMDFYSFQFDSYYDEVCGHIQWFDDNCQGNIQIERKSCPQKILPFNFSESIEQNIGLQAYQNQLINTQSSIYCNFDQNFESEQNLTHNENRTKNIVKSNKNGKIKNQEKNNLSSTNLAKKRVITDKTKSKYNNMGGFLIGTFSEILNTRGKCRFLNGAYQIEIDGLWMQVSQFGSFDHQLIEKNLFMLKFKLSKLPRRDGSKKHIFQIINTDPSDTEETKISKSLIRKELIYSLSQESWLMEHIKSRDFKPQNDDELGTKKIQRHQNYLVYLKTMKNILQIKDCIPKRIIFGIQ